MTQVTEYPSVTLDWCGNPILDLLELDQQAWDWAAQQHGTLRGVSFRFAGQSPTLHGLYLDGGAYVVHRNVKQHGHDVLIALCEAERQAALSSTLDRLCTSHNAELCLGVIGDLGITWHHRRIWASQLSPFAPSGAAGQVLATARQLGGTERVVSVVLGEGINTALAGEGAISTRLTIGSWDGYLLGPLVINTRATAHGVPGRSSLLDADEIRICYLPYIHPDADSEWTSQYYQPGLAADELGIYQVLRANGTDIATAQAASQLIDAR